MFTTRTDATRGCCRQVTSDELTYNGQSLTELVPERSAAFISQLGGWALWWGPL